MTEINIQQLIADNESGFQEYLKKAEEGNRYYSNKNDILRSGAAAIDEVNAYLSKLGKNPLRSADNRIPTNWHKVFVDQKTSYLFTYPPQFDTDDADRDKELLQRISKTLGRDYKRIIKQLGIDASNTGRAWLAYWYEKPGDPFEYYFVDPLQVMPVYDNSSIKPKLQYLIRRYATVEDGKEILKCEVWTDREVLRCKSGEGGLLESPVTVKHSYGEIPFIEFRNNAAATGDLCMYKRLIDCIDKLISGYANDIDDIQEIIWVIKNYAGATQQIDYDVDGNPVVKEIDLLQQLKAAKLITVDDKGGVDAIHGEIPYEARCQFLDILQKQIYISAMAVDSSPDKTGNESGVYIEYLYGLLELKAGLMETEFTPALDQFVHAVLRYLNISDIPTLEQKWTRNKPRNDTEIASIIASTPNTVVSDETKTKEHPLVENWSTERTRIAREQKERAKNYMDELEFHVGAENDK